MPPKALCLPPGLIPGDVVMVKWEQKFAEQAKGIIFVWRALVEAVDPDHPVHPLVVRFQCDEKLGQKNPDVLPFREEGRIVLDIKKVKPKRGNDVHLAPPTPAQPSFIIQPAKQRSVKVLNNGVFTEVTGEWKDLILEGHAAYLHNEKAPSCINLVHCGVLVKVDLKNRTIGENRQVLHFGELS